MDRCWQGSHAVARGCETTLDLTSCACHTAEGHGDNCSKSGPPSRKKIAACDPQPILYQGGSGSRNLLGDSMCTVQLVLLPNACR